MAGVAQRLESLDVLRGFDLFCLTIAGPLLWAFNATGNYPFLAPVMKQFTHVAWTGFTCWDLVMTLFMFMSGVSIPFAFSKYLKNGEKKTAIYKRIFRRVILLWILGAVCQGNLLALDIQVLKVYSNTLQAIASGYLIASVLYIHCPAKGQIFWTVFLLLLYWGLMTFVKVGQYGGGNFTPEGNLAEWLERIVLGRWRDGAHLDEGGNVVFPEWYSYTWILSSLNFGVTVMSGVFAGEIIRNKNKPLDKVKKLLIVGVFMVMAGWLWGMQMPVIKTIWTSSMVLVSSGYCFCLMGIFYYWIDYKGHKKGLTWLKVIGMNSILAYVLSVEVGVFDFSCLGNSVLYGFELYLGKEYYHLLLLTTDIALIYFLLYWMYRHKFFLKV